MYGYLLIGITLLFLLWIGVYLVQRRQRLDRMEENEKWMESLPDDEWDVSDPWTSESTEWKNE